MAGITSKFGEPGGAFLLPIGETNDLTTSGKGVVSNPQNLLTSDFSDAGEDFASISDNTFEANGSNYFVNQVIRGGNDDGNNYVVKNVGGTSGTDTITVDRNIQESNGDDIFTSQYYSIQTADDPENHGKIADSEKYLNMLYIFVLLKSGYTSGQVHVIFADGTEISDFELSNKENISLVPMKKIVLDDNNVLDTVYFCKAY
ncbi:MAG: hypothetical protein KGY70_19825 [Bacteroidales bacterium]|nr:hypothetical protein [Bacteroidales bacterium]